MLTNLIEKFKKLNYCFLRNYEFLFGGELPEDIDILVSKKDSQQMREIILQENFIQKYKSNIEEKYCKYENKKIINLHIHLGGLYFHRVKFLGEEILGRKIYVHSIPVPADEELVKELILHSILRGKFKEKYIAQAKVKNVTKLLSQRNKLVFGLFKQAPFSFTFDLLWSYLRPKKKTVIAFAGIDGVGKTTMIESVSNILRENNVPNKIFYMGKWRNKTSFVNASSKISLVRFKLLKTIGAVIDMYLRAIKLATFSGVVLTDRYAYDLVIDSKIAKVLLLPYPAPDFTILLSTQKDNLLRRGYPVEGYDKFYGTYRKLLKNYVEISTKNIEDDTDLSVGKLLPYIAKNI